MRAADSVNPNRRQSGAGGVTLAIPVRPASGLLCRVLALAALLALLGLLAAAHFSPVAAEARQAAQEILSDGSFQTELPLQAREEEEADRWNLSAAIGAFFRWLAEWLTLPPGLAGLIRLLLWASVLVTVALLVFFLLNELPRLAAWRRSTLDGRGGGQTGAPADRAGGPSHADPLDWADHLAREGRQGEAIHMLLLHSLEHLRTRPDARIDPSLTGREIVDRLSLEEDARSALARIVAASELGFFGGRSSSQSDYESCRKDYGRLARTGGE